MSAASWSKVGGVMATLNVVDHVTFEFRFAGRARPRLADDHPRAAGVPMITPVLFIGSLNQRGLSGAGCR